MTPTRAEIANELRSHPLCSQQHIARIIRRASRMRLLPTLGQELLPQLRIRLEPTSAKHNSTRLDHKRLIIPLNLNPAHLSILTKKNLFPLNIENHHATPLPHSPQQTRNQPLPLPTNHQTQPTPKLPSSFNLKRLPPKTHLPLHATNLLQPPDQPQPFLYNLPPKSHIALPARNAL